MQTAATLPPEVQDDLARMVLSAAGQDVAVYQLTEEDIAAVKLSGEAAARRVRDRRRHAHMWARFGL